MRPAAFVASSAFLIALSIASVFIGSGHFSATEVWGSLLGSDAVPDVTSVIVRDYRVPRTLMALLVGMALGVAGVLMQTTARNPLADPGLLGVNAGAYLAVVLAALVTGATLKAGLIVAALVGAGVATIVVHIIGARGLGAGTPAKLVLTGVAVTAVATGIASAISLMHADIFDKVRYWRSGSLQGVTWDALRVALPFILVGLATGLVLTSHLNALLLGDDSARGLGVSVHKVRLLSAVSTTLLAGAATAVAGPISFVGLMVPHAARTVVGPDLRWLLPAALIVGPALVLSADIVGRLLLPGELPMGVVTAFVGAPVLVYLVRRRLRT